VNTITDPRGSVVSNAYDANYRLTTRTYPGGSYEAWEYDAAGNCSRLRNRSGQWLNYSYDSRNRETHHWWDGGVGLEVNTQYDTAGRVTQRTSTGSTVTYSYNAAGQLTEEHQAVSGAATKVLVRQYDQDGNQTRLLVSTQ
jgi:YD repeat-containing protein